MHSMVRVQGPTKTVLCQPERTDLSMCKPVACQISGMGVLLYRRGLSPKFREPGISEIKREAEFYSRRYMGQPVGRVLDDRHRRHADAKFQADAK